VEAGNGVKTGVRGRQRGGVAIRGGERRGGYRRFRRCRGQAMPMAVISRTSVRQVRKSAGASAIGSASGRAPRPAVAAPGGAAPAGAARRAALEGQVRRDRHGNAEHHVTMS